MAFVQLGSGSARPTYFEVLAADKLVPGLKAAWVYSLAVLSQRSTTLRALLDYEDEAFAVLLALVDWHSLSSSGSTFSESLYGLTRKARTAAAAAAAAATAATGTQPSTPSSSSPSAVSSAASLDRRQRLGSLLLAALLPYLQTKAEKLYKRHSAAAAAAQPGVLGLALRRSFSGGGAQGGELSTRRSSGAGGAHHDGSPTGPAALLRGDVWPTRERLTALRAALLRGFVAAYPPVQAALDALVFVYDLSYLLGLSDVHSPVLHVLGLSLQRVSAADLQSMDAAKQAWRKRQLDHATSLALPEPFKRASRLGLRAVHFLADNGRNALILAVFGFKALEWWYTTAEQRLAASRVLPPPPPPPPPLPSPHGVGLPKDPRQCPVCRRAVTNPAQVAVSGYVFCYPCVFNYVMANGCCPVTQLPARLDHVRKLYDAAAA